jgi:hypothetical protein
MGLAPSRAERMERRRGSRKCSLEIIGKHSVGDFL